MKQKNAKRDGSITKCMLILFEWNYRNHLTQINVFHKKTEVKEKRREEK